MIINNMSDFSYTYYIPNGSKVVSTTVTSGKDIPNTPMYIVRKTYICDDSTEIIVKKTYDNQYEPDELISVYVIVNNKVRKSAEIICGTITKEFTYTLDGKYTKIKYEECDVFFNDVE